MFRKSITRVEVEIYVVALNKQLLILMQLNQVEIDGPHLVLIFKLKMALALRQDPTRRPTLVPALTRRPIPHHLLLDWVGFSCGAASRVGGRNATRPS